MKVTVCFDDIKVIVPCGSSNSNSSFLNSSNFKLIDATISETETGSLSTSSTCSSINSILKLEKEGLPVSSSCTTGFYSNNNNCQIRVSAVIESSIARFKKATGKTKNCVINVLQLQTVRDGGILDPDDFIQDVVEDKELLTAIYEEINYENQLLLKTNHHNIPDQHLKNPISNSLDNSSLSQTSSNSTNCSNSVITSIMTANTLGLINSQTDKFYTNNQFFNPANVSINNRSNFENSINNSNYHMNKPDHELSNEIKSTFSASSNKDLLRLTKFNKNQIQPGLSSPRLTKVKNGVLKKSGSESCIFIAETNTSLATKQTASNKHKPKSYVSNSLTMSSIAQRQRDSSTNNSGRSQYFNRVNSSRQSSVRNASENGPWSNTHSSESSPVHTQLDQVLDIHLEEYDTGSGIQALGIHVIPTFDSNSQCDMGLIIQRIEPNARVAVDGRIRQGDRIIEINQTSLIGVDFIKAQDVLRETISYSNQHLNGRLDFKIVRWTNSSNANFGNFDTDKDEEEEDLSNERPIEVDMNEDMNNYHDDNELQYAINKQNYLDPENKENTLEFNSSSQGQNDQPTNTSFINNNTGSVNMNALNTKKLGKKISVQLIKGPQGLGFKLAARDNCSQGEFSPIYIKNILPKGAAITDGRLQRGDRLLEVNGMEMTKRTLHEAVNLLRNTKLGSCVEIVVSRQMMAQQDQSEMSHKNCESGLYAAQLPREISPDKIANGESENTPTNNSKRQLLTLEIALNDTGSAGLGVSVKGKTKRIEENDCSIDLGIFIKTVINGGAASKDGQLKPNDQLININGFSLLGKSNEEAMLILREAMQVESKPGYIQLTVSRKVKITEEAKPAVVTEKDNKLELSPQRKVVKVIQHGASPPKVDDEQPLEEAKVVNRFSRDAPNRRSMSEKRTKIGNASHTAEVISKYNRALNDSSSDSNCQAKRSKTAGPVLADDETSNFLKTNVNSKTLHRNFKPSYLANSESASEEALTANLGEKEKQRTHGVVRPIIQQNDNSFKRMGSIDSVASRAISSSTSATIASRIEQLNQLQQKQHNKTGPKTESSSKARRSISMESIPHQTQENNNNLKNTSVKNSNLDSGTNSQDQINRFRSINRSFRTAVDKSFDVPTSSVRRSVRNFLRKSEISLGNNFRNRRNQNDADKKLPTDGPTDEEKSSEASKKLNNKRGLMETFQKLFKSSNTKQKSQQQQQQQVTPHSKSHQQLIQQENAKPELINYQKRTLSALNAQAHKETLDVLKANKQREVLNSQPIKTMRNTSNLSAQPTIEKPSISKFEQFETMIDNNTLYTQYKPTQNLNRQSHPSAVTTDCPNLISTSSASSTSTVSCSSASSSSSYSVQAHQNQPQQLFKPAYFANRESLFYHSTDNYRYNNSHEQQMFREKQKKITEESQNQQRHISRILEQKSAVCLNQQKSVPIVKHSVPVNVSNQVHTICDMFEEDLKLKNVTGLGGLMTGFNRYGRNQSSTKSNPPDMGHHNYINNNFNNINSRNIGGDLGSNTIIEDEYFHRSFKTNFSQNFHNPKMSFNLQTPVIIPHPAQV